MTVLNTPPKLKPSNVGVYSREDNSMGVCAIESATTKQVEELIKSLYGDKWFITDDTLTLCEHHIGRLHYLLHC